MINKISRKKISKVILSGLALTVALGSTMVSSDVYAATKYAKQQTGNAVVNGDASPENWMFSDAADFAAAVAAANANAVIRGLYFGVNGADPADVAANAFNDDKNSVLKIYHNTGHSITVNAVMSTRESWFKATDVAGAGANNGGYAVAYTASMTSGAGAFGSAVNQKKFTDQLSSMKKIVHVYGTTAGAAHNDASVVTFNDVASAFYKIDEIERADTTAAAAEGVFKVTNLGGGNAAAGAGVAQNLYLGTPTTAAGANGRFAFNTPVKTGTNANKVARLEVSYVGAAAGIGHIRVLGTNVDYKLAANAAHDTVNAANRIYIHGTGSRLDLVTTTANAGIAPIEFAPTAGTDAARDLTVTFSGNTNAGAFTTSVVAATDANDTRKLAFATLTSDKQKITIENNLTNATNTIALKVRAYTTLGVAGNTDIDVVKLASTKAAGAAGGVPESYVQDAEIVFTSAACNAASEHTIGAVNVGVTDAPANQVLGSYNLTVKIGANDTLYTGGAVTRAADGAVAAAASDKATASAFKKLTIQSGGVASLIKGGFGAGGNDGAQVAGLATPQEVAFTAADKKENPNYRFISSHADNRNASTEITAFKAGTGTKPTLATATKYTTTTDGVGKIIIDGSAVLDNAAAGGFAANARGINVTFASGTEFGADKARLEAIQLKSNDNGANTAQAIFNEINAKEPAHEESTQVGERVIYADIMSSKVVEAAGAIKGNLLTFGNAAGNSHYKIMGSIGKINTGNTADDGNYTVATIQVVDGLAANTGKNLPERRNSLTVEGKDIIVSDYSTASAANLQALIIGKFADVTLEADETLFLGSNTTLAGGSELSISSKKDITLYSANANAAAADVLTITATDGSSYAEFSADEKISIKKNGTAVTSADFTLAGKHSAYLALTAKQFDAEFTSFKTTIAADTTNVLSRIIMVESSLDSSGAQKIGGFDLQANSLLAFKSTAADGILKVSNNSTIAGTAGKASYVKFDGFGSVSSSTTAFANRKSISIGDHSHLLIEQVKNFDLNITTAAAAADTSSITIRAGSDLTNPNIVKNSVVMNVGNVLDLSVEGVIKFTNDTGDTTNARLANTFRFNKLNLLGDTTFYVDVINPGVAPAAGAAATAKNDFRFESVVNNSDKGIDLATVESQVKNAIFYGLTSSELPKINLVKSPELSNSKVIYYFAQGQDAQTLTQLKEAAKKRIQELRIKSAVTMEFKVADGKGGWTDVTFTDNVIAAHDPKKANYNFTAYYTGETTSHKSHAGLAVVGAMDGGTYTFGDHGATAKDASFDKITLKSDKEATGTLVFSSNHYSVAKIENYETVKIMVNRTGVNALNENHLVQYTNSPNSKPKYEIEAAKTVSFEKITKDISDIQFTLGSKSNLNFASDKLDQQTLAGFSFTGDATVSFAKLNVLDSSFGVAPATAGAKTVGSVTFTDSNLGFSKVAQVFYATTMNASNLQIAAQTTFESDFTFDGGKDAKDIALGAALVAKGSANIQNAKLNIQSAAGFLDFSAIDAPSVKASIYVNHNLSKENKKVVVSKYKTADIANKVVLKNFTVTQLSPLNQYNLSIDGTDLILTATELKPEDQAKKIVEIVNILATKEEDKNVIEKYKNSLALQSELIKLLDDNNGQLPSDPAKIQEIIKSFVDASESNSSSSEINVANAQTSSEATRSMLVVDQQSMTAQTTGMVAELENAKRSYISSSADADLRVSIGLSGSYSMFKQGKINVDGKSVDLERKVNMPRFGLSIAVENDQLQGSLGFGYLMKSEIKDSSGNVVSDAAGYVFRAGLNFSATDKIKAGAYGYYATSEMSSNEVSYTYKDFTPVKKVESKSSSTPLMGAGLQLDMAVNKFLNVGGSAGVKMTNASSKEIKLNAGKVYKSSTDELYSGQVKAYIGGQYRATEMITAKAKVFADFEFNNAYEIKETQVDGSTKTTKIQPDTLHVGGNFTVSLEASQGIFIEPGIQATKGMNSDSLNITFSVDAKLGL